MLLHTERILQYFNKKKLLKQSYSLSKNAKVSITYLKDKQVWYLLKVGLLLYSVLATCWLLCSNNHGYLSLSGSSNSTRNFCNDQTLILDEQDYQYWQIWKLSYKKAYFCDTLCIKSTRLCNWTERKLYSQRQPPHTFLVQIQPVE